jgi:hypothetical protein
MTDHFDYDVFVSYRHADPDGFASAADGGAAPIPVHSTTMYIMSTK